MTLLEVIVGLVVAGLFLSALLPTFVQSYTRFKAAELQQRAFELATSKIEAVSQGDVRGLFPREGRDHGLSWRIDLDAAPAGTTTSLSGGRSLRTYRVSVSKGTGDPLTVLSVNRLHTER